MNKGEYFKIETVQELKQAYEMFEDEWYFDYTLQSEIEDFNHMSGYYNMVLKDEEGDVWLSCAIEGFKEIPSPLKNKTDIQKTLEIGELNIQILKALTSNGLIDSKLTGQKAQEIVDKTDELTRTILK